MSNGNSRDPMKSYHDAMRSKAAIEAAKSYLKYQKLIADGWPSDKAFQMAFLGVMLLFIPGLKPVPEPDPPFELESLHHVLKSACADVKALLEDMETDLASLKRHMRPSG